MDDYLAISALQHFAYCARQFALIHVEQGWSENRLTAEGRVLHERVDEMHSDIRHGVRSERAVSLTSRTLRLTGKMDLLEIKSPVNGQGLAYYPVEYKRGEPKVEDWDRVQLCAQALCLEEMHDTTITEGAIWYWQVRRREPVRIDRTLRATTLKMIEGARGLLITGVTPSPVNDRRCPACSLRETCGPATFARDRSGSYIEQLFTSDSVVE